MWGDLYVCNLCPYRATLHQNASSSFFICHLQVATAATCISVIRPVVSLRGKLSSVCCQWFNTVRTHIAHARDRSVLQPQNCATKWLPQWTRLCVFKQVLILKTWCLLCCYVINILILLLLASCLFQNFHRCFEWETPSQKDLIPFICVVFSNAVPSWKNALALPVQNSGSKGFLSVTWNSVKSVQLKTLTFCSCKSTLVCDCFYRCYVCQIKS